MIRIRTKLDNNNLSHVYTVFFNGRWITYSMLNGHKLDTLETPNLMEAGATHLRMSSWVREALEDKK